MRTEFVQGGRYDGCSITYDEERIGELRLAVFWPVPVPAADRAKAETTWHADAPRVTFHARKAEFWASLSSPLDRSYFRCSDGKWRSVILSEGIGQVTP